MNKIASKKIFVTLSPKKSLRDLTGQAGGVKSKKVFVAMSGGVDSSVAAALLKKQCYEVTGVFMRLAGDNGLAAARKVAKKLGIKFLVWDFRREFKKAVIDYFLAELKAGRTPNPCVVCNPQIKFGLFLKRALKAGADHVATGHYAQNRQGRLFIATDKQKDQSYFLYGLNHQQLSKIIFPLGDRVKKDVYKLAKKMKLPYRRGESFDICFAADYQKFVRQYFKRESGRIIQKNKTIDQHYGLLLYTIGQRASVGGPGPFYVIKKDIPKNILYVSNNEKDLYQKQLAAEKINWINKKIKLPINCQVKIRYSNQAAPAILKSLGKNKIKVIFKSPQRAITPGQSAVFYGKNDEVLGGGIIY